ncbi:Uncharacterized protein TCM_039944 [Theobroma cacao]|uniref:Uncharacterized protein n=1 Tax=Theobroma cacao TaxID=3641 RepID=A0A061GSX9_THECC|nr:Uncharacterized protein TCM_039944 [Theobroma cacao]
MIGTLENSTDNTEIELLVELGINSPISRNVQRSVATKQSTAAIGHADRPRRSISSALRRDSFPPESIE